MVSERLLGTFVPSHIEVGPVVGVQPSVHEIWNPCKKLRGKKKQLESTWNFDLDLPEDGQEDDEPEGGLYRLLEAIFDDFGGVGAAPDEDDADIDEVLCQPVIEETLLINAIEISQEEAQEHPPPDPALGRRPSMHARSGRNRSAPGNLRIEVEGGSLAYYAGSQQFNALCRNTAHVGECRMTRTKNADSTERNMAKGRPLGFLQAWLLAAEDYQTAEDHMKRCRPPQSERQFARGYLTILEGIEPFFAQERPARTELGEDSEPEEIP